MGQVLGIIGGGQLGMMLAEAAKNLPNEISEVIVLDPTEGCPASRVGAKQIIGDFKDEEAIAELVSKSDILTYEIESGNSDVLKAMESRVKINPSPETLKIIQDKLLQKTFLSENGLPVPDFIEIKSLTGLQQGIEKFGYPALLKTRRDAYDGRGNFKINSQEDIKKAFEHFGEQALMLEKYVDFKKEVSVIAARNTKGEIATYPLVENIHEENILMTTIAPARVNEKIIENAEQIAKKTMNVLKGAGVFGIEMFVTQNDEILINEIAPRVHNSGHHTLQSSKTSQFEQHLRAILGMSLGSTELVHHAVMYNILGSNDFKGKFTTTITDSEAGVFHTMYNKNESKPKRKLGHINILDIKDSGNIPNMLDKVERAKKSLKLVSV